MSDTQFAQLETEFFLTALQTICQSQPEQIALQGSDGRRITYAELWQQSLALGIGLQARGVCPGDRVAIGYGRSSEFVLALLACWQAGAVWLPLGDLPPARQAEILDTAEAHCVLGPAAGQLPLAELTSTKVLMPVQLTATSPAYLIFTSGSTGQPKGVLLPHAGIVPMLKAQIELFELGPASRSLWLLSPLFDASLSDIGTALLSGATLVIDPDPLRTLEHFYQLINKYSISYLDLPPALLGALDPARCPSLRCVTIGGEVAASEPLQRLAKALRLINVYGPTEATVCCSAMLCWPAQSTGLLGQPLPGVAYTIDGLEPYPGLIGELWISSAGLALGYWRQPELSATRFVEHAGQRWYRSGDRVEVTASGDYRFLGRLDRQLKHLGRLICPEEIEGRLLAQAGIQRAQVLKHTGGTLIACLQGERQTDQALQHLLAACLPAWMIPTVYFWPEPWPMTASGKSNSVALAQLPLLDQSSGELSSAEAQLATIWQQLLGQPVTSPEADFIALGGSSVQVLICIAQAAEAGLILSPESFYRERKLRAILSQGINKGIGQAASSQNLRQRLPAALKPQPAEPKRAAGSLLLTGATGFLGSRLLAELLRQSDQPLQCLVRARDQAHGRQRLDAALAPWLPGAERARALARVQLLCGDLSQPGLGLADSSALEQTGAILHCAAQVDLVRDFESLYQPNLMALARLAALGKPLHYVSTLSVLVAAEPKPAQAHESDDLSTSHTVYGGYAQSKWAAEVWLRQQNIESWIYRPGLVTGDSQSGQGPARDWLGGLIRGLLQLGSVPNLPATDLMVDISPVDYVAAGILALMQEPSGATFHLANPCPLGLNTLLAALANWGELQTLPLPQWLSLAQTQLTQAPGLAESAALLAMFQAIKSDRMQPAHTAWHSLNLFQATGIQLASPCTQALLSTADLHCPLPDADLLNRYFQASLAARTQLEALHV